MTRNQIDWQNMLISRSRAKEDRRHNRVLEELQAAAQTETARANRAKEAVSMRSADTEFAKLQEAIRNNDVVNYLTKLQRDETTRNNLVKEANERFNISTQHLDRSETNRINAAWNEMQRSIKALEHLTTKNFKEQELINQANKIAHDYEIAKEKLAIDRLGTAAKVADTFSSPLKNIGQLFKR